MNNHHWNNLIGDRGPFLESWEWGVLQESLGNKIKRIWGFDFAATGIVKNLPFKKCYIYFPRGPVMQTMDERTLGVFLRAAKTLVDPNTIFLKIEPAAAETAEFTKALVQLGFTKAEALQPDETRVLDLKKPETELLKDMEYETRYAIRTAEKRGVVVLSAETQIEKMRIFGHFWKLFRMTNLKHGLKAFDYEYYAAVAKLQGECDSQLFYAKLGNEVISAAIIVFFKKTAVYLFAASKPGLGRFNAPSLLLWRAILTAKNKDCEIFDLWGASETNKKWERLTAFKKSFGGKQIKYAGAWDYILDVNWYKTYRLVKKFVI